MAECSPLENVDHVQENIQQSTHIARHCSIRQNAYLGARAESCLLSCRTCPLTIQWIVKQLLCQSPTHFLVHLTDDYSSIYTEARTTNLSSV